MKETIQINLNDYIIFTPSDTTADIWNKYWGGLAVYNYPIATKKQKDGRVKLQLHEFMRIFGPHVNCWNVGNPFKTTCVEIEKVC